MRIKSSNLFWVFVSLFTLIVACKEDDATEAVTPSNLVIDVSVSDNQSGLVTVTPSATDAISFLVSFDEDFQIEIDPGDSATYTFQQAGQYTKTISVIAFGSGFTSITQSTEITLDVQFVLDETTLGLIAGTGSKRWVWDRTKGGHLGVGPLTNDFAEFFSANPNELNPCIYDDVLMFSYDADGNYTYTLEPGADNLVLVNWAEVNRFFPAAAVEEFVDECRDITDQAAFTSDFVITTGDDGKSTLDVGDSFLSYWAVIPGQYEIVELTENKLTVRGISAPFNDGDPLAWYSTFIPEGSDSNSEPLETIFDTLVWSDEFDTDGAPDPANWGYDLGNGDNGWGNGEAQSYTDSPSNVVISEGNLNITARAEDPTGEGVYYFDDFQLLDGVGESQAVIEDFEGTAPTFNNFGGAFTLVVANPDMSGANTSATVAQTTKPQGSETFAASFFDLGSPLDLQTNPQISVKTWSPIANAVVRLKLEDSSNGANFAELDVSTTTASAWEELVFDFSSAPDFNYDRVVIFFDFGNSGTAGPSFSSARIKSEGLQEFTYGRVEARAKLPTGGGTWPAIWMLGADYLTNPWPAAGEMDIMEHVGNSQDIVFASTHDPNNFGGNARTGSVFAPGVSDDFHIYEMEWTETEIKFAFDGNVFHTVSNDGSLPFNKDFFFILNVAMGGSFGGAIDSEFTESTMQVDYIRMYQ